MLNFVDFPKKQNSAFNIEHYNRLKKDVIDRKKFLSDYEISTIKAMACTNILNAMDYQKEEVIINWKIKKIHYVDIKNYGRMVDSITKSLISPLKARQAFLLYMLGIINVENFKKSISVIVTFIRKKINK